MASLFAILVACRVAGFLSDVCFPMEGVSFQGSSDTELLLHHSVEALRSMNPVFST